MPNSSNEEDDNSDDGVENVQSAMSPEGTWHPLVHWCNRPWYQMGADRPLRSLYRTQYFHIQDMTRDGLPYDLGDDSDNDL